MSKKKIVGIIASSIVGGTAIVTWIMKKKAKKTTYKAENIEAIPTRNMGFYEKYVKRAIDIICASAAIICFSPIYRCCNSCQIQAGKSSIVHTGSSRVDWRRWKRNYF